MLIIISFSYLTNLPVTKELSQFFKQWNVGTVNSTVITLKLEEYLFSEDENVFLFVIMLFKNINGLQIEVAMNKFIDVLLEHPEKLTLKI